MALDIYTLLVVNVVNALLMAATLPLIMGSRLSQAASHARLSLIAQAVGWIFMILAGSWKDLWQDQALSTLSIASTGIGQWLLFQAMAGWLGPRKGSRLLLFLVVITPLGYTLSFQSYPLRVGWANFLLALQLLLVCQSTLRPASRNGGAWRWVIFASALTLAILTAGRGVLGAFFTELYPTFRTPHPVNQLAMLMTNVAFVLGNMAVLVAWRSEAEAQLRQQASTDALTGLLTRHGWDARAGALFDQARRHNTPLALVMLDLDQFKRINDTRGHEVGDQVLRLFSTVLLTHRRSSDLAARIGGEEFALLLPHTDRASAMLIEQRLRAALKITCGLQPELAVDYSAGLALLQPNDDSLTTFMVRADTGLYLAKSQGRGRVQVVGTEHHHA
ncbi:MAG: GGDEF domain-containing protein [Burkholderiales bacterium]|nr:GGDEF domain-containing protein [Burkholderiales bacterium]